MRKEDFYLCENKGADQPCACVFATAIVLFLFFINYLYKVFSLEPSSHSACTYSSVCVEPVRKPHSCLFSHGVAHIIQA